MKGNLSRGSSIEARSCQSQGQYAGDYESGKIWALNENGDVQVLSDSRRKIASFGMSPQGDLLVASFNGGIEKLARSNPDPNLPLPRLLSETGCESMSVESARDANLLLHFVNYPFE